MRWDVLSVLVLELSYMTPSGGPLRIRELLHVENPYLWCQLCVRKQNRIFLHYVAVVNAKEKQRLLQDLKSFSVSLGSVVCVNKILNGMMKGLLPLRK